jgi:hypothetical protein
MTGSQLIEVDGRIWCDFGTGVLKTAVFGTVLIGRDSCDGHHIEVAT